MKTDLRLVPADSTLARLQRVLSSLASVPELPARLGGKRPSPPLPASSPEEAGFSNSAGLVVEFDEAYTDFVDALEDLPTEVQMIALQAVDTKLSAMVRAEDPNLWTVQARVADPRWIEVRVLVVAVLDAFSLPVEVASAPRASDAP